MYRGLWENASSSFLMSVCVCIHPTDLIVIPLEKQNAVVDPIRAQQDMRENG